LILSRTLLDSGVFISAARGDRSVAALMKASLGSSIAIVGAHCLAEFYRGGGRSAREAQLLNRWRVEMVPVVSEDGKLAGALLAATRRSNSMDALVVAVASRSRVGRIFTSDPGDIGLLREALPMGTHRDFVVVDVR